MKKTMIAMALLAMTCMTMNAQPERERLSDDELKARRAEMVQKQAERLAKDFELKDDAKTNFVNLYTEYQDALQTAQQTEKREGTDNKDEKKTKELTDDEAKAKIAQYFEKQEQQIEKSQKKLAVEKEYYAKFAETLTPQQLVKIFTRQQRGGNRQGGQQGNFGGQGGPRGGFGGQGGPQGGFGGGDF